MAFFNQQIALLMNLKSDTKAHCWEGGKWGGGNCMVEHRFQLDKTPVHIESPFLLDTCYLTLHCNPTTLPPRARTLCGSQGRIHGRFNGWVHAEFMQKMYYTFEQNSKIPPDRLSLCCSILNWNWILHMNIWRPAIETVSGVPSMWQLL